MKNKNLFEEVERQDRVEAIRNNESQHRRSRGYLIKKIDNGQEKIAYKYQRPPQLLFQSKGAHRKASENASSQPEMTESTLRSLKNQNKAICRIS